MKSTTWPSELHNGGEHEKGIHGKMHQALCAQHGNYRKPVGIPKLQHVKGSHRSQENANRRSLKKAMNHTTAIASCSASTAHIPWYLEKRGWRDLQHNLQLFGLAWKSLHHTKQITGDCFSKADKAMTSLGTMCPKLVFHWFAHHCSVPSNVKLHSYGPCLNHFKGSLAKRQKT